MGAVVEAAALAAAMRHAASVVEARGTNPILAMARLVAAGDSLELTTTNLDIEYRQTIALAAPCAAPFALAVDAGRLAAIAGVAGRGAQIAMDKEGAGLVLKSGRSRWNLPVLPVDDFPVMPAEMADSLEADGGALAALLRRVDWSTDTVQARYYLCGTLLDGEAGKLRAVTTNGHCLTAVDSAIDWPEWAQDAIVPQKLARLVAVLADEAGGAVRIGWTSTKLRIEAGAVTVTGKLIDGAYPDYRRLFPSEPGQASVVDPEQMRTAIRQIALISRERTRALRLERREGVIALGLTSADYGSAQAEVAASTEPGPDMGINAEYLAGALEAIGGDSVEMTQRQPGEIIMIRRVVSDGAAVLIMPMRL